MFSLHDVKKLLFLISQSDVLKLLNMSIQQSKTLRLFITINDTEKQQINQNIILSFNQLIE